MRLIIHEFGANLLVINTSGYAIHVIAEDTGKRAAIYGGRDTVAVFDPLAQIVITERIEGEEYEQIFSCGGDEPCDYPS